MKNITEENKLILDTVFSAINSFGLDYCVQNKYEMMPEEIPSDIDIFYQNSSERELDEIVRRISKETGLVLTQKIPNGYMQIAYMFSHVLPQKEFQLQLDFYPELSSKYLPHVFIPKKLLANKRLHNGFYVPNYYDEIYYQVARRVVKKDFSLEHIKNIDSLLSQGKRENIFLDLELAFGVKLCSYLKKMIETKSTEPFYGHYDEFYLYFKKKSKKNSTIAKWFKELKFKTTTIFPQRVINPCGLSIAFLSPDGGGKSTVIEAVSQICAGSFHGVENRYFRPRLFKNPGSYHPTNPISEISDNPDPHGRPVNSLLKSMVRFFFYNFDFLLGTFFVVFPIKIRRKLLLFDRYYYDYYVDMKRYQLNLPKWFPGLFSFMIPNPDLTFILDAPGQVLYDRKKELSVNELNRQRDVYLELGKTIKNAHIIDATQPITKVVEDITKLIILKKSKQTSKKLKV